MSKESSRPAIFFGGTFAWVWVCYFAIVLLRLDPYRWPGLPLLLAVGSAPTWMGIGMAMVTKDSAGRYRFWRRFYGVRLNLAFVAIGLLPCVPVRRVEVGYGRVAGAASPLPGD
jgi:hypothetical protein